MTVSSPSYEGEVPILDEGELRTFAARGSRRGRPAGFSGRGALERIRRAVAGDVHPDVARSVATMAAEGALGMDSVTAALLRHAGANPAVVAAVSALSGGVSVRRLGLVWSWTGGGPGTRLGPEGSGWWNPASSLMSALPRLPETVVAAACGRPLRSVLSHPALDDLPLSIGEGGMLVADETRITVEGVRWLREELADMVRPA